VYVRIAAALLAFIGAVVLARSFFRGRRTSAKEVLVVLPMGFWGRARQLFWGLLACLLAALSTVGQAELAPEGLILCVACLIVLALPQQYTLTSEGVLHNGRLLGRWEEYSGFFADEKYAVLFADSRVEVLWGQNEQSEGLLEVLGRFLPRAPNIQRSVKSEN